MVVGVEHLYRAVHPHGSDLVLLRHWRMRLGAGSWQVGEDAFDASTVAVCFQEVTKQLAELARILLVERVRRRHLIADLG